MKTQNALLPLTATLLLIFSVAQAMSIFRSEPPLALPAGAPTTNTPVNEVTFVLFDTETTGLSSHKERLIEIAAIKFQGEKVL